MGLSDAASTHRKAYVKVEAFGTRPRDPTTMLCQNRTSPQHPGQNTDWHGGSTRLQVQFTWIRYARSEQHARRTLLQGSHAVPEEVSASELHEAMKSMTAPKLLWPTLQAHHGH